MQINIEKIKPFGAIISPISSNKNINQIDTQTIKQHFNQESLIVFRGFETFKDTEHLISFCEQLGDIIVWPFGKILELIERDDPKDHIFDSSYVPMHWDGMYRPEVPQYQVFQCVQAPKTEDGGRTTFSHTPSILQRLSQEKVRKLKSIVGTYQRDMEFYDSKTVAPIVDKHPLTGIEVIRYNEPVPTNNKTFINPPIQKFSGIQTSEMEDIHNELREALYSENNLYSHQWQDGDIVIADNFTLLHGREAFTSKSPRHLRRVQVMSTPRLPNPHLVRHK